MSINTPTGGLEDGNDDCHDRRARRRSSFRGWLSIILGGCAIAYLWHALNNSANDIEWAKLGFSWPRFAGAITASVAMTGCNALYHDASIRRYGPNDAGTFRVSLAFALNMLIRYVPGKIWGIVFETNFLRGEVPSSTIVASSALQMLYHGVMALVVACILAATALLHTWLPLVILVPAIFLIYMGHRHMLCERAVAGVAQRLHRFGGQHWPKTSPSATYSMYCTTLLSVEWIAFVAMWWCLSPIGWDAYRVLALASGYALASLFASALVILPSGLIVREALFAWMGVAAGIPQSGLLLLAALARLTLTIADILCVPVFFCLERIERRHAD